MVDPLFNFLPGVAAGFLLGWAALPAVLLGGVTWISSSGIIAKVLADQGRLDFPETPVDPDGAGAGGSGDGGLSAAGLRAAGGRERSRQGDLVAIAFAAVGVVLFVAVRYGRAISRGPRTSRTKSSC